jgi:hypothetical protein
MRGHIMKSWVKVLFTILFISLFSFGCGGGGGGGSSSDGSGSGSGSGTGSGDDNGNGKKWVMSKYVMEVTTDAIEYTLTCNYTYDAKGNRIKEEISMENYSSITINTFNQSGLIITSVQDAYSYDTSSGHTYHSKSTTSYTYDSNGDAVQITMTSVLDGNTSTIEESLKYNSNHDIIWAKTCSENSSCTEITESYTYDSAGNKTSIKYYNNSGTLLETIESTYDSHKYVKNQTVYSYANGQTYVTSGSYENTYDANENCVTSIYTQNGSVISYTYTWISI